jgi:hypothetical protein
MAIKKQPDVMIICNLECILMPNGEIISAGKTVGWFKEHGKYLQPLRYADGSEITEEI